jgi:thiamine biosynthesis lipoprotein
LSTLRHLKRRDFLRLASLTGLGLAVPVLAHSLGDVRPNVSEELHTSMYALGTMVTIRIEHVANTNNAQAAVNSAFQEIRNLETTFTRFQSSSEVGQLNLVGHIDSPQPRLLDILDRATEYSEKTEASFDITVKPALDLFENRRSDNFPPSEGEFDEARRLIDFEKLSVSSGSVSFDRSGMGITLDCLGKGYVLDHAAQILKTHGIDSALIDGGGTLIAIGARGDGSPWEIGIMNPLNLDETIGTIELKNLAVATSGDYENAFTADKQYYHIIDPRTATSPLYSHSATVVAPTASEADPLGLALMVKSPSESLALIDQFAGCECLVIPRNGSRVKSAGFGMI